MPQAGNTRQAARQLRKWQMAFFFVLALSDCVLRIAATSSSACYSACPQTANRAPAGGAAAPTCHALSPYPSSRPKSLPMDALRLLGLCGAHSPCPFRITAPPSTAAIIYTCRRYGHRCCRTSPITSGCSAWGLWLEGRIVGVHIRQRCNFLRGHGPNRTGPWSSHLSLYKEHRAELNEGRGNQTQRAEG